MIDNLRTEPRDFGEDSGESGGGTTLDPYKTIKLGNFDNWAISFKDEIINGTDTEYALKQLRCVFMIEALKNAMDKGEITSPDEFWTGFDFSSRKDENGKVCTLSYHLLIPHKYSVTKDLIHADLQKKMQEYSKDLSLEIHFLNSYI